MLGTDFAFICAEKSANRVFVFRANGKEAATAFPDSIGREFLFRMVISKGAVCRFYFSGNGKDFVEAGPKFISKPGRWVGAKIGLFCTRTNITNDAGFADIDWIRFDK